MGTRIRDRSRPLRREADPRQAAPPGGRLRLPRCLRPREGPSRALPVAGGRRHGRPRRRRHGQRSVERDLRRCLPAGFRAGRRSPPGLSPGGQCGHGRGDCPGSRPGEHGLHPGGGGGLEPGPSLDQRRGFPLVVVPRGRAGAAERGPLHDPRSRRSGSRGPDDRGRSGAGPGPALAEVRGHGRGDPPGGRAARARPRGKGGPAAVGERRSDDPSATGRSPAFWSRRRTHHWSMPPRP